MKELRFYEYGGFQDALGNESDSISDTALSSDEIQYLRSISETASPGKAIFDITASKIRATSMVGVISFGGVHIEVLPKLLKSNQSVSGKSDNSILQNLMFMLSYTNAIEVTDSGVGSLARSCDSFIEAYISIFGDRLSRHLIRFGSPKAYVERSENLNTVKGKISFAKHSVKNTFDQSRIFCDFSEFTEDNGLSQAFKYVAQSVLRLTRSSPNVSALSRCVGLLDGVQANYISSEEVDRLAVGKRDPNFVALVNLTKMFLKKLRPEFSGQKKDRVFTLLFDMNELFEEFIYQVLKRHESVLGIQVAAQKRKRLVSAERDFLNTGQWVDRSLFDTYTDISVKPKDGPGFIIDTKYKIVHSRKSHYGIGNQDAYQVLAYRQIHKLDTGEPSVALLYPRSGEDLQKEFRVNGSGTTFMAWTVDISVDLRSSMESLVHNLRDLIACATTEYEEKAA